MAAKARLAGMSSDRDMSIERTMALYGVAFAGIGALGILFFWSIGAVNLVFGNGGFINDLDLGQTTRTLFLSYPVVVVLSLAVGIGLFLARREREAVAISGLPVMATIAFYLGLVLLR
jgi:hypothetical protein